MKKAGSSFPNMPNVGTDTLHDFHGCVGNKHSLETLIGGNLNQYQQLNIPIITNGRCPWIFPCHARFRYSTARTRRGERPGDKK